MPRKPLAVAAVTLTALVVTATAAAGRGFAPETAGSPNAERTVDVYWLVMAFAVFVLLLVTVPLMIFIVRYRNRGGPRDAEGPQIRGNTRLEVAWTVVPVLILVVISAYVFYKLPGITEIDAAPGATGETTVRVEGRQFYWQFEYPNGVIAVDRLRAPLDRRVRLDITAPSPDVIHSFWVPSLGGKFDALPGETNTTSFRAQETGVFEGVCGEFCGIQHAAMLMSIEVLPARAFDRWLANEAREQEAGTSDLGEASYVGACGKCHGAEGEGFIGPALAGNAIVTQPDQIAQVARNGTPDGGMPAIAEGWSERQMEALTDYMRREFAPEGAGANGG